jgi:hypothetical protein
VAKFTMRLRSVGNPDFNQYAPVSDPMTVTGDTLQEMRKKVLAYIEMWNLGCGNFLRAVVKDATAKKAVAWISYNGRVWDRSPFGKDWRKAKKIVV